MAKRQSTSNVYRRRNRSAAGVRARRDAAQTSIPAEQNAAQEDPPAQGLGDVLRTELGRLAEAQSVLACLQLALTYADRDCEDDPDYSRTVAIALSLVRETANRLDAAWIARVREAPAPRPSRRRVTAQR